MLAEVSLLPRITLPYALISVRTRWHLRTVVEYALQTAHLFRKRLEGWCIT